MIQTTPRTNTLRILLFLLALGTFSLTSWAQNYNLQGRILDADGSPLAGASVAIEKASTHQRLGAVTDAEGHFKIGRVSSGSYTLTASFVGYKSEKRSVKVEKDKTILPIVLKEDHQMLDQVVVTGKANEVLVKGDTLVFNADSYKVPEGGMLQDLIKRLPGVEIAADGSITVNGESISKIMIDGKEFFSGDPSVATQNLPAELVKHVEVLSKKSDKARMSGFDDDEEETVINLTTKKDSKKGIFGNLMAGYSPSKLYELNAMINQMGDKHQLTLLASLNNTNNRENQGNGNGGPGGPGGGGQGGGNFGGNTPGSNMTTSGGYFSSASVPRGGITTRGHIGINGNYTPNDQWDLNGNLRYGYRNRDLRAKASSQELLPNGKRNYANETLQYSDRSHNAGIDGYFDWQVTDNTEIVYRPMFFFNQQKSLFASEFASQNEEQQEINRGSLNEDVQSKQLSFFNDLNVSHRLNDLGRTLSYSINANIFRSDNETNSLSSLQIADGSGLQKIAQQQNLVSNTLNYRMRLSYVEAFTKNFKLQAMVQWSQNLRKSQQDISNVDPETKRFMSDVGSLSLNNALNTFRTGLHLKYDTEKLTLTLGLNASPTALISSQQRVGATAGEEIRVEDFFLSPMVNMDYNPNKQTSLKIRYWGRPQMPNASQMFDYVNTANALNTIVGNPNLKPYFNHGIAAMFRTFLPSTKQSITARAFGYYNQNAITTATEIDPASGKRSTTYVNGSPSYGTHFFGMFNTPLFIPQLTFSITSRNLLAFSSSFVNQTENRNTQFFNGTEAALGYTYEWIYMRLRSGIDFSKTINAMRTQSAQAVINYRSGGEMTLTLPFNITLESDVTHTRNTGYGEAYNRTFTDWNASVGYSFGKKRAATVRVKAYDILNQGVEIRRSSSASSLVDVETNSLGRYLMFSFIYKFNIF